MIRKSALLLLLPVLCTLGSFIAVSTSHAATSLTGSYGIARMVAGFPGSSEAMVLAGTGSVTFNANGSCTASLTDTEYALDLPTRSVTNYSGTETLSCSYTLNTNGDLTLAFAGDALSYQGSVGADGASLNLAGRDSGTGNKVMVLVGSKSGTGMSAAALNGSYGIARTVAGFPGGTESMVLAGRGSISFNGSGSCNASLNDTEYALNLTTGAIASYPDSFTLPCSYSVNGTGALTVSFTGDTHSYQGHVSADGSSFTLAGPDSETQEKVMLLLGNKIGVGVTSAVLKGSYGIARGVVGFAGAPAEAVVLAGSGGISFDGKGGCSASLIDTEFGLTLSTGAVRNHSDTGNLFCSYSVAENGTVTLTFAGDTSSYQGTVSSDGSSFTLAGPDSASNKKVTMLAGERLSGPFASLDLAGTWMSAGIKIPMKNTSDSKNFGYDVDHNILHVDGSGSNQPLSSSDGSDPESFPAGTLTIDGNGIISSGDPNDFFSLNAAKDVMFQFRKDTVVGEQQLFVDLKLAQSYSSADLAGTWVGAGLKTPVKLTYDPDNFGYDVDRMTLNADGSGTTTPISTSDPSAPDSFPAGSITIASDGTISPGDPNDYFFMNAAKDVMFQFRKDTAVGEQQLFVNLKQAAGYTAADLAGIWYGAGMGTPIKGNSNAANFGYEVTKLELFANGSGSKTQLSASDPSAGTTFPANYFKVAANGTITSTNANEYFFMNASKDVMFQFKVDPVSKRQQLYLHLKQPASASAPTPVNGACGSAHGATLSSAPTANLCSSGSASPVSGSGPWTWSCLGENGGSNASCSASLTKYSLTVTLAGSGSGTVNSDLTGIACSGTSASGCTASFPAGSRVQLFATPGSGSLFGGWSGGASGSATSSETMMTGNKAVTATFNSAPKAKVGSKPFASLQAAYDDADTTNDSAIHLIEGMLTGSLTASKNIAVKVEGGYNSAFSTRNSSTTIPSPLLVRRGTVKILGVKIKGQ